MKTQEIGQSGMIASRVALGVMRMDALDAADAARTVAVAHDSGIDYFDTADIYGFHDHAAHASSKRFGQAWKDAGLDRSTIFIQTKFGIDYSFGENDGGANGYDFSAKHLIDALDHELEALQTDYVDAVLLHRIDTLFELNEVAEAFDALESSGKVRHFGVSNMGPWQIELLQSGLRQKLEINRSATARWRPGPQTPTNAVTGGRCIRQPAIRWCEREMTRPLPLRRVFSVHTSQRQSMLCQSTHDENNDTNIPRITSERRHIERGN